MFNLPAKKFKLLPDTNDLIYSFNITERIFYEF